jgi:CheY-like chemotaxis protein
MNLAINARDAMPGGGRLVVETRIVEIAQRWDMPQGTLEAGDYVQLTVSDTGAGIDAETLPRIFEPFFTTKPVGHGTGLGLATVYGIATQSGGTVHVYSNPGKGTAFHVYLPQSERDLVSEELPPEQTGAFEIDGLEVLLVEDEALVREVLTEMLTQLGCRVHAVPDAEAAFAAGARFDLLVTDYLLPKMNGRDLAARLEADNPRLKTIFMSGYTGHTVLEDADLAAATFLQKPFGATDLSAKLVDVFHG